jgi:hypothetical protein
MSTQKYNHDDVIFELITALEEFSLLPELFRVVGQESLGEIIKFFGGKTIYIPSRQEYENLIRKAFVFCAVQNSTNEEEAIKEAAHTYQVPPAEIRVMLGEVREAIQQPVSLRSAAKKG